MNLRLVIAALTALLVACGDGEPDVVFPPTPTVPAVRTGIAEVDAVIAAVSSGDVSAFDSLVRFDTGPCTREPEALEHIGRPTCRLTERDGTPIDFLPQAVSGVCRIATRTLQVRADQLDVFLAEFATARLYAVYSTKSDDGTPQYTALWAEDVDDPDYQAVGQRLVIEDGEVVSTDTECAATRAELVQGIAPEAFVLPPTEP